MKTVSDGGGVRICRCCSSSAECPGGSQAVKALNINRRGACFKLRVALFSHGVHGAECNTEHGGSLQEKKKDLSDNFYFTKSLYQGIIVKWKSI